MKHGGAAAWRYTAVAAALLLASVAGLRQEARHCVLLLNCSTGQIGLFAFSTGFVLRHELSHRPQKSEMKATKRSSREYPNASMELVFGILP